jgi:hypothetical protein
MKGQGAYSLSATLLKQKRIRAFSVQYLSLFLLIVTMILPLYGDRTNLKVGNGEFSLPVSINQPDLFETPQSDRLSSFPFEGIFLDRSSDLDAKRFEILKIFLQSHNLNIQLTISGPLDSLPLLFERAMRLENSLVEAFSPAPLPPIAVGIGKTFLMTAEIYSGEEYDL